MYHYIYTTKDTEAECPWDYLNDFTGFVETRFCNYNSSKEIKNFKDFEDNFKEIFNIDWNVNLPENTKDYIKTVLNETKEAGYLCLPIWGYSHSGYCFCANETNPYDKWDSGLAGFIWSKTLTREELNDIVEELNAWTITEKVL